MLSPDAIQWLKYLTLQRCGWLKLRCAGGRRRRGGLSGENSFTIWLCYMPEAPVMPDSSPMPPPKSIKKESKRVKVKDENKVKQEMKAEGRVKQKIEAEGTLS